MRNLITTQILIENNKDTIESCLHSLPENINIIFGDIGSTDGTLDVCKKYGSIYDFSNNKGFDEIRNDLTNLSKTDWQFYINPWENILSGKDQIPWATTQKESIFNIYNMHENNVVSEARMWKKGQKFTNPVYETLEIGKQLDCVISGFGSFNIRKRLLEWKRTRPQYSTIDYYLALMYLSEKNYDNFISSAEFYIFKNAEHSDSLLLINYYLSMVNLFIKRDTEKSFKHIFYCLVKNPSMAEFWCLLGDIFFAKNQHKRAMAFYDNAIVFGKKRKSDGLPVELNKYKEYPEKMISKCLKNI